MQAIFNVERVESSVTLHRGNNVANNENSTNRWTDSLFTHFKRSQRIK